MSHPLDGKYLISTTTNYQGPLEKKSDGETEIVNSQTHRVDAAGCTWTSTFEIISDTEVKMTSLADPTNANDDFALVREDGSPTREPQTYTSTLKFMQKGERVQISGKIEFGDELIFITMRKI